jgi:integrase
VARQTEHVLNYNVQQIRAAKPIGGLRTEYAIKGERGLWLVVLPSGVATYVFRYTLGHGRGNQVRGRFTIGRRDEIDLADARAKTEELRKKVSDGVNPNAELAETKDLLTFKELAEKRLIEDDWLAETTKALHRQCFKNDVFPLPAFSKKPARDVTPSDVAAVISAIADGRGSTRQADATKSAIGAVYKWAKPRWPHLYPNDPSRDLGRRSHNVPRDRVLRAEELILLLKAIDDPDAPISKSMRLIFKIALLTGKRRTEVCGARKSELSLDGATPIWTIPGDTKIKRGTVTRGRSKNGVEQIVRLSPQAVVLLREALALVPDPGDPAPPQLFVFPAKPALAISTQPRKTPHVRGDAVTTAMRRLRDYCGLVDEPTTHDLRRTFTTWLGNNRTHATVIEIILGHVGDTTARRHYDHSLLEDDTRAAWCAWADYLDRLER